MSQPYRIELLDHHDRRSFTCGDEALDNYFHKRVRQDVRRRITLCYVLVDNSSNEVAGFYTLSMGSVSIGDLPESYSRKLPRYPQVPIVRVGRLAIHVNDQGKGLGGVLIHDVIVRSLSSGIAAYAVVVDAKDDKAASFYQHFGFVYLSRDANTLFLPLQTF